VGYGVERHFQKYFSYNAVVGGLLGYDIVINHISAETLTTSLCQKHFDKLVNKLSVSALLKSFFPLYLEITKIFLSISKLLVPENITHP
jgi:hypothetical protein